MNLHTEAGDSPASNMAFTASIKGDLQSSINFGLNLMLLLDFLPAKICASFKIFNYCASGCSTQFYKFFKFFNLLLNIF